MSALGLLLVLLAAEPSEAGGVAPPAVAAPRPAAASPEKRAPASLLRYLRQKTVSAGCDASQWTAAAPLSISQHFELSDGRLLLFVQIPDYFCKDSNSAVPVVVSAKGEPRWGLPISGAVTHLARSEDGLLWAATQWQIEGTYPMLFKSIDALAWKEVELPAQRATAGPSETLEALCLSREQLVVHLVDPDGAARESWTRDSSGSRSWSKEDGGASATTCAAPAPPPTSGRWRRDDSREDRFVFIGQKASLSVPKLLRPR
ncbi:MAG: hypothetical protein HY901_21700 [Deltaproteobacteria bacterium]|nr:hypothetical protein [Deltaproteobacteria bacterium]